MLTNIFILFNLSFGLKFKIFIYIELMLKTQMIFNKIDLIKGIIIIYLLSDMFTSLTN